MGNRQFSKELRELLRVGRLQKYSKKQIIQSSDEELSLCLVKSGFVKRYLIAADGTLGVQSIYGPGDIFPLTVVFKVLLDQDIYEGPEVYYYEAMSDTEVYKIDSQTLLSMVKDNPLLYRDFLTEAGRRFLSNIQRLENVSLRSAYKRVAHQLVFYARQFGKQTPAGTAIQVPLTQQEIANILSATRETVSLSITELRKKKLVQGGKVIVIPDVNKLEEEAFN